MSELRSHAPAQFLRRVTEAQEKAILPVCWRFYWLNRCPG